MVMAMVVACCCTAAFCKNEWLYIWTHRELYLACSADRYIMSASRNELSELDFPQISISPMFHFDRRYNGRGWPEFASADTPTEEPETVEQRTRRTWRSISYWFALLPLKNRPFAETNYKQSERERVREKERETGVDACLLKSLIHVTR